ncbi:uncharacterized protein METZ01_LOCUS451638, partial [marine metagenome]
MNYIKSYLFCIFCFTLLVSQDVMEGWIIYTPQIGGGGGGNNGATTYLKNESGNTIKTWDHARGAASMPYLLPDSSFIYPYRVQNPTMNSGGVGGGIQYINWDGDVL